MLFDDIKIIDLSVLIILILIIVVVSSYVTCRAIQSGIEAGRTINNRSRADGLDAAIDSDDEE